MKKISKCALILTLVVMMLSGTVFACGPSFDEAYFVRGSEEGFFAMPGSNFLSELERIANKRKKKVESRGYEGSAEADVRDLEESLSQLGLSWWKRHGAVKSYSEARKEMSRFVSENSVSNEWNWVDKPFRPGRTEKKFVFRKNFAFSQYVPMEFYLYVNGAVAYRNNDAELAIGLWKQLLSLKSGERRFKSVWAAFMIGKVYLALGRAKESIPYFEQARKLASEGYKDSLNLSVDSISWQARAELEAGDIVASMHHYFEVLDSVSLSWVCEQVSGHEETILQDNLCRRIFLGWRVSRDNAFVSESKLLKFLGAVKKLGGEIERQDADRIAWILYNNGDFAGAKEWLSQGHEKTILGRWLWVKLMLREGAMDSAISELQELLPLLEKTEEWNRQFPEEKKKAHVYMGMLKLSRRDYLTAFRVLCHGAYWEDAAYVAEKVLTVEELENALVADEKKLRERKLDESHYSGQLKDPSLYSALRYLLARRYARLGNWDKAGEFMPESLKIFYGCAYSDDCKTVNPKKMIAAIKKMLGRAEDVMIDTKKRAKNYYAAAVMMRKYGMELCGTELDPDWFDNGGNYEYDSSVEQRFGILTEEREKYYSEEWYRDEKADLISRRERMKEQRGVLDGSEDEEKRVLASLPEPVRRYHYRYRAADLMWKCAELLPANDKLKAKALCVGGTFTKIRDPQYAYKFYKELIDTCPNTKLGKEALELKWFPEIDF